MTKKLVFINGEFNDTNTFIRENAKGTLVKIQFTVYYDDSIQFDMLKIESGAIDKIDYKGREFKIYKVIRMPLKDSNILSDIKKTLRVRILREKRKFKN